MPYLQVGDGSSRVRSVCIVMNISLDHRMHCVQKAECIGTCGLRQMRKEVQRQGRGHGAGMPCSIGGRTMWRPSQRLMEL